MTKQEKFDHTVQVLVQAYLNDTLEKGNCQACVVGNLIAYASGSHYIGANSNGALQLQAVPRVVDWLEAICTDENGIQEVNKEVYFACPEIRAAFDSTGYSFEQLTFIEHAFESNNGDWLRATDSKRQFAGLMAVINALADIHGINLETATRAKALFVHA